MRFLRIPQAFDHPEFVFEPKIASGVSKGLSRSGQPAATNGDRIGTSWLKVKNPGYSQMRDRHELFEGRRDYCPNARQPFANGVAAHLSRHSCA